MVLGVTLRGQEHDRAGPGVRRLRRRGAGGGAGHAPGQPPQPPPEHRPILHLCRSALSLLEEMLFNPEMTLILVMCMGFGWHP